jgi:hypothetical protein
MKKSRTYSIYQRHFILTAGLILVAFILLGIAFLASTFRYAVAEKKKLLETDAVQIAKVAGLFQEDHIGAAESVRQPAARSTSDSAQKGSVVRIKSAKARS